MPELVDLVDAAGEIRLRRIPRSLVREQKEEFLALGLFQPIVVLVVFDEDARVIAQVRGPAKGMDGAGEIDHVCGVISSGETWEVTAAREAAEEIGATDLAIRFVTKGVNIYQRYRTLAVGTTTSKPKVQDEAEVAAILTARPEELENLAGEGRRFVRGFFDDLSAAVELVGN